MRETTTALGALFVVLLPWMGVGGLSLFHLRVIAADIVFVPFALLVVIERLSARALPSRTTLTFVGACGLYALVRVGTALVADDPDSSLRKAAATLVLPALGVTFALFVDDERRMRAVLSAWRVALGLVVAYAAIGAVATFVDGPALFSRAFTEYPGSVPSSIARRAVASFENYNMLATYLTASVCLVWAADDALGRWRSRALIVGATLLAFATFSPGLGGLALAGALLFTSQGHVRHARLVRTLGVVVASAVFVSTWFSPRALFVGDGPLAGPRVLTWRAALDAWTTSLKTFVVGHGPGAEPFAIPILVASGSESHLTDAHHIWLSVAVQSGLVGVVGLALVLVAAFIAAREPLMRRERHTAALVVACAVLWGYDGLTGSFEDTRHFWVLAGLVAAQARPTAARMTSTTRS